MHWSPYSHRVEQGVLYTDNGFWDTHRTCYPLLSLIVPSRVAEIVAGFINGAREGGDSEERGYSRDGRHGEESKDSGDGRDGDGVGSDSTDVLGDSEQLQMGEAHGVGALPLNPRL